MSRLPQLVAILFLAAPALAEEPGDVRELVRAALLEGAPLPMPVEIPGAGAEAVAGRPLDGPLADAEHDAHRRAAEHAARHAREAPLGQRGDGAADPMHGGAAGLGGMDGGTECRDAAGNRRTRGMDGGGGAGPGPRDGAGMHPAALQGSAAAPVTAR